MSHPLFQPYGLDEAKGAGVQERHETREEGPSLCDIVPAADVLVYTGRMGWMAHWKWKESKQQPSMLPGPAVPGCCFFPFPVGHPPYPPCKL